MYAAAASASSSSASSSSASAPAPRYLAQGYRLCDAAPAPTRPRTLLDLARDKNAPNSGNARALVQERGAIFANLALHCECLLTQVGIAVPPATDYSNAAQIRKRLTAPRDDADADANADADADDIWADDDDEGGES